MKMYAAIAWVFFLELSIFPSYHMKLKMVSFCFRECFHCFTNSFSDLSQSNMSIFYGFFCLDFCLLLFYIGIEYYCFWSNWFSELSYKNFSTSFWYTHDFVTSILSEKIPNYRSIDFESKSIVKSKYTGIIDFYNIRRIPSKRNISPSIYKVYFFSWSNPSKIYDRNSTDKKSYEFREATLTTFFYM